MSELEVGYYGDDFTGSVDVLLQFARHGWTGRLFVGVPPASALHEAASQYDVVGIAGIARSLPTVRIEAEVRPALEALLSLSPRIVQYKACSTADSSPEIGSIGRVIEIGRDVIGERTVPMLFAQPDFGRYTVFGHHFAAENGAVHRLDRQPTMSTHPSTPMRESDLARHFRAQTALPIGNITRTEYADLAGRILETDAAAVVLDASDAMDATAVGRAVASLPAPAFVIGSGGLSWGIAAAAPREGVVIPASVPAEGPVLAVSGSRSAQTQRQIDAARSAGWLVEPLDFVDAAGQTSRILTALRAGQSVALTSEEAPQSTDTLEQIARTAAETVRAAASLVRRVIIAGGDTSGRVTRLLNVDSLEIVANPTGNIVLLRARSGNSDIDGLELLLKGGQVGDDDLFESIRTLGS